MVSVFCNLRSCHQVSLFHHWWGWTMRGHSRYNSHLPLTQQLKCSLALVKWKTVNQTARTDTSLKSHGQCHCSNCWAMCESSVVCIYCRHFNDTPFCACSVSLLQISPVLRSEVSTFALILKLVQKLAASFWWWAGWKQRGSLSVRRIDGGGCQMVVAWKSIKAYSGVLQLTLQSEKNNWRMR